MEGEMTKVGRRNFLKSAAALGAALGTGGLLGMPAVRAQEPAWPNRPVHFIVPLAPGGGIDFVARAVGAYVRRHVGQPIVVENRTGAGGTVGMDAAMRSPSDGYIVLVPEVRAQEPAWPNRPVHFIVPLAPGGGIDFVARAVGAYDSAGRRSFRLPFQLAGFSPFRYSWALHQSNTLLNPLAQPQRQFGLL
jgi:tripartite-type tricarboxylate transporter receptor subunit TctC